MKLEDEITLDCEEIKAKFEKVKTFMDESISIVNSGLAETVETSSIKEDVVLHGETLKEVAYSNYSVLKG